MRYEVHLCGFDDFLRHKKNPALKEALTHLGRILKEHYGLMELVVHGPGQMAEVVQLLDAELNVSQMEALRKRLSQ